MCLRLVLFVPILMIGVGCSPKREPQAFDKVGSTVFVPGGGVARDALLAQERGGDAAAPRPAPQPAKEADPPPEGNAPAAAELPRRIIYNGTLSLVVNDFEAAEGGFKALVKKHGGYIATGEVTGSAGTPRHGSWKVRVPAERFDDLADETAKLGIPETNRRDSQDVSEEYYDLADRIKTKKAQQETLRGYLQDKKMTSRLEDILVIEKELNRVRGEIDSLEGRQRRLRDLSALGTLTVSMKESKDYVPPQAPTFGGSVQATFGGSLDLLSSFGQGVVLVTVALAPWLAVLSVFGVPGWLIYRRTRKGLTPAAAPSAPPTPG